MFIYCSWNKQAKNCTELFHEILTADGFCCSFSSLHPKVSEPLFAGYNGMGNGLFVILDPMLQPTQYSSLHGSGFKVRLIVYGVNKRLLK